MNVPIPLSRCPLAYTRHCHQHFVSMSSQTAGRVPAVCGEHASPQVLLWVKSSPASKVPPRGGSFSGPRCAGIPDLHVLHVLALHRAFGAAFAKSLSVGALSRGSRAMFHRRRARVLTSLFFPSTQEDGVTLLSVGAGHTAGKVISRTSFFPHNPPLPGAPGPTSPPHFM